MWSVFLLAIKFQFLVSFSTLPMGILTMAQNNYNKNPFDLSRVLTQHWRVVSNVLSLLVITRGQWHGGYLQIKWLMLLVISHILFW
jgi:hypothetical protein